MPTTGRLQPAAAALALALAAAAACAAAGDAKPGKAELDAFMKQMQDHLKAKRYDEAVAAGQKAVELASKLHGQDHEATADALLRVGLALTATGRAAEAEPLLARCLRIREAKLGKDHAKVGETLYYLGLACRDTSQYAKAEAHQARSLAITERAHGKEDLRVAVVLEELGWVHYHTGRHDQAEPVYLRALAIRRARLGEDHLDTARTLSKLGFLYSETYRYSQAEQCLLRVLKVYEAKLGKDDPSVGSTLWGLGVVHHYLGQFAKAEAFYHRALGILEPKLGKDSLDVSFVLNSLAMLYEESGRHAEAEAAYLRCLRIKEAALGKDHLRVAVTLGNLAGVYENLGQYPQAEKCLLRVAAIRKAKLGPDHPGYADALRDLGDTYCRVGQYAKSESLYLKSLSIAEAKLGGNSPPVGSSCGGLAALYAATDQPAKAAQYTTWARRVQARHVTRVLSALSVPEQVGFLWRSDVSNLNHALSLGLAFKTHAETRAASAEWVLNGKARGFEVLSARWRLAMASSDPNVADAAAQLRSVRLDLARLATGSPPAGDFDGYRKRLAELTERERLLTQQLGRLTGEAHRTDPWVGLPEVRQPLPAEAVLVEIARFELWRIKAEPGQPRRVGPRYAAWVVPPGGDVKVIDLGPAEPIDSSVAGFRQAAGEAAGRIREVGAARAEAEFREKGYGLAGLIWGPLAEAVGEAKHIIVSPDGALWLVPWEALPIAGDKYLVEDKLISYVVTGRDLVAGAYSTKSAGGVVFADPDYDLGASEARAETKRLLAGEQVAMSADRSGELARVRWGRLAGAAAEAEAVTPKLQQYVRSAPSVYTGKRALEGVFKSLRSPRVLLMSTHGFFLADQDYSSLPAPRGTADRGTFLAPPRRPATQATTSPTTQPIKAARIENPLLRCGLVLAGANHRDQAKDSDDGVLTGLEIVGTDLRGTELVVLSACETGLGQVLNGEGVSGLRQAFQLAGAKTVVSTLWKIPDRQTADLMSVFFGQLAAGEPKAASLRRAQLRMIARLRAMHGAAHPFYWAAFTLTGQWR